jgi:DNA-binding LytR/AlgR family response regulator
MEQQITKAKHHCYKLQANGIIRLATLSEIVYLKAKVNYTCFVLKDLSQFTMCQTLLNFEIELGHLFFRCHKSYLINMIYIREINKRNHQVILTTGEAIPFSRNKAKILEDKMKIRTVLNYQM